MKQWTLFLTAAWFLLAAEAMPDAGKAGDPPALYLTWQRDPTTTMTVNWLSPDGEDRESSVSFRPKPDAAVGDPGAWTREDGTHRPFPGANFRIHSVELTGLSPDRTYEFRLGPSGKRHTFRTMPAEHTRPIRFLNGGDSHTNRTTMAMMLEHGAARDPDFLLMGGDISGADGRLEQGDRWRCWLGMWQQKMVAPDGRLIPLVPVIGNHEVTKGGFGKTNEFAPFFYSLFLWPGETGRGVLDFGDYLSVFALDTGHTHAVEGEQTEWLEKSLEERKDRTHLIAAIHVPAWPAHRAEDIGHHRVIRKHWVPLFERYGVDAVFQHHDHCFMRSHPIRSGEVDPHGVLYLGNGGCAPGVGRRPDPPGNLITGGRWYIARSGLIRHLFSVTLAGPVRRFEAFDPSGYVFDTYQTMGDFPAPIIMAAPWRLSNVHTTVLGVAGGLAFLFLAAFCYNRVRRRMRGRRQQA